MSKLSELNASIAALQEQLTDAEARRDKAGAMLAGDPSDQHRRDAARAAEHEVADLRGEIHMLENARAAAIQADASEQVKDRKRQAVAKMDDVRKLLLQRNALAKQLDAKMAAFAQVCQQWKGNNDALGDALKEFRSLACTGARKPHLFDVVGDFEQIPVNAILSQFDAAARAMQVPPSVLMMSFRTERGEPEDAAPEVLRSVQRIEGFLQRTAESEDLQPAVESAEDSLV